MSLQNTGLVDLEYKWQLVMVDQQTASDIMAGVYNVATPPAIVVPEESNISLASERPVDSSSHLIEVPPSPALRTDIGPPVLPPAAAAFTTLSAVLDMMAQGATDADIPFSVTPVSGQITAGATAEILVKFSPLDVAEYFACLYARYLQFVVYIYLLTYFMPLICIRSWSPMESL